MPSKSGANQDSNTPPVVSLIAGGVAGAVEAGATYPFEFAKTRVQLRQEKGVPTPRNPFLVVRQVFRDEGVRAMYKGCSTLVIGSVGKDGIRFLGFDTIKNAFKDPETGTLSPIRNMLAGMGSGVAASIFAVTPTERIKTALIDDARHLKRFNSPTHAVRLIYAESGFLGLYRGFAGTTLKQAFATAFRMGTYNILKDYENTHQIPQTTATNFANGTVAGITTTYATQPFDCIKTRSQSAKEFSSHARILPLIVDKYAREQPNKPWASIQKSTNPSDGFQDVTYAAFANAINRAAWFVDSTLGKCQDSIFDTVSYMGKPDVRYFIMLVALIKTGYVPLFLSHRNSLDGQLGLLAQTRCKYFLYSTSIEVEGILDARAMRSLVVPELEGLLDEEAVPHYAYTKTVQEALNDPLLRLHTSGTTGLPKAITFRHGNLALFDFILHVPDLNGYETIEKSRSNGTRVYLGFPLFHAGGMILGVISSVYHGMTIVLADPDSPPTAATFSDIVDYGDINGAYVSPSALQDISKSSDAVEKLARLKFVLYGGATLKTSVGNTIRQKTRLINSWASTEVMCPVTHVVEAEDWEYVHVNPTYSGIEFRLADAEQGLYEAVAVRNPDVELARYQPPFWIYPQLTEWPTHDLFSKHHSKPNHWRHEGRSDDMIVLEFGHNFHPTYYETQILSKNPLIRAALIVGSGRPRLAVILELYERPSSPEEKHRLLKEIWPTVEECNHRATSSSQIGKEYVIFASAVKPFLRAGKGTVQRAATVELYKEEIDRLYTEGN
ncbi:hypothetical protein B0A49_03507, partial [Cryomyces minteri]